VLGEGAGERESVEEQRLLSDREVAGGCDDDGSGGIEEE
jgi:hypothetical protein